MYDLARNLVSHLPSELSKMVKHVSKSAKNLALGSTIFEQIGFDYFGPIDGHNLTHLIPILESIRDHPNPTKPILLHIVTEKGRGFPGKNECAEKFHAVAAFDAVTGIQKKSPLPAPSYTEVFARGLIAEATHDPSIVAITAAMPSGTGLDKFARAFPHRCFDVGIAEQHAVTMAAGLACEGMKPFVAIYSTFLQRAYDQVVHDVALQSLPVRFAIDRAGYVGADGPTHNGAFDITFLATLPNMVVMAPSDEVELLHAIATACTINDRPSAFRYPRGAGIGLALPERGQFLPVGKGRIVRASVQDQSQIRFRVAILSLGTRREGNGMPRGDR
jgi:1-deoxy-D-xylulose-5-phosphate synthase